MDSTQKPGTFAHTRPSADQSRRYARLQAAFEALESELRACVPPGRELSVAVTSVEQGAMWANKGVSRGDGEFNAPDNGDRA